MNPLGSLPETTLRGSPRFLGSSQKDLPGTLVAAAGGVREERKSAASVQSGTPLGMRKNSHSGKPLRISSPPLPSPHLPLLSFPLLLSSRADRFFFALNAQRPPTPPKSSRTHIRLELINSVRRTMQYMRHIPRWPACDDQRYDSLHIFPTQRHH